MNDLRQKICLGIEEHKGCLLMRYEGYIRLYMPYVLGAGYALCVEDMLDALVERFEGEECDSPLLVLNLN
jgi:hypothetical protein